MSYVDPSPRGAYKHMERPCTFRKTCFCAQYLIFWGPAHIISYILGDCKRTGSGEACYPPTHLRLAAKLELWSRSLWAITASLLGLLMNRSTAVLVLIPGPYPSLKMTGLGDPRGWGAHVRGWLSLSFHQRHFMKSAANVMIKPWPSHIVPLCGQSPGGLSHDSVTDLSLVSRVVCCRP